jgi:glycosyltransferase involved in cell wall biosynthesis
LDIDQDKFVFLFFGNIREYKGVIDLINAFNSLNNPQAILVIAGRCSDRYLLESIKKLIDSSKIFIFNKHIEDNEVQVFFSVADIVVFPFKKVTSSGSVMLALSLGKPVVIPDMGDLVYIPDIVSYKYDPKDELGLLNVLKEVIDKSEDVKNKSTKAKSYAGLFSWKEISDKTYEAYKSLFGK